MGEELNQEVETIEPSTNTEVQGTDESNNNGPSGEQYSEIEIKAMEMGWRPKDNFDGDDAEFIPAEEFVRRKPLFEKIEHVSKELRETRKAMKMLQDHHEKVREIEYKKALEQLRSEKKAALESGDADRLIEIDDMIAEAKTQELMAKQQAQQQTQTVHPGFAAWVDKNKWYQSSREMRAVADQVGTAYAVDHPDLSPDQVLEYVEKRIKKMYPDNFQNPNKTRPSAVEGGSTAPTRSSEARDTFQLTEEERKVMNTFVRQNIMTKEEYIAELKKVRG